MDILFFNVAPVSSGGGNWKANGRPESVKKLVED
jgi:hypothetical protein